MIEHSYIRQDAASHVLTKTTDEIKDYYTETYINGVIGEGMIWGVQPDLVSSICFLQ